MSQLLEAARAIVNAAEPMPGIVTGGQPTADQLRGLRAAGCEVVLDIRDPMEARAYDEPAAARGLGLEYLNIPVTYGALTPEVLARVLETIHQLAGRRKTLYHCGSGNRVGATLIPYFMKEKGMSEEDAIDAAMVLGLRRADLVEWALEYVRTRA